MTSLVLEHEPAAVDVRVSPETLTLLLTDGRSLSIPLTWYPRLLHATEAERSRWQLLGNGYAIEWPEVDEHISVEGVLAGRKSCESKASIEQWLAGRAKVS